jgi:hypothetical protein
MSGHRGPIGPSIRWNPKREQLRLRTGGGSLSWLFGAAFFVGGAMALLVAIQTRFSESDHSFLATIGMGLFALALLGISAAAAWRIDVLMDCPARQIVLRSGLLGWHGETISFENVRSVGMRNAPTRFYHSLDARYEIILELNDGGERVIALVLRSSNLATNVIRQIIDHSHFPTR